MRLVFLGTPAFAIPALAALVAAGHEICAVYSQPPRPAKRGQRLRRSAVHTLAEAQGLEVRTPKTFKDETVCAGFAALGAEAAVVAAYGLLLPQAVLAAPTHGCLNIHASLLPRWRGAAPIHRAIAVGDAETGISIMQMEAGLDSGPVLLSRTLAIAPLDTAGSLHDKLASLGGQAMVEALADLAILEPKPQPEAGVTYAKKIDKAETLINWQEAPEVIARKIRAFSPFPGAWFEAEGERIKVINATVAQTVAQGAAPLVRGGVALLKLQRAGKNPQIAEDFLRGFPQLQKYNEALNV